MYFISTRGGEKVTGAQAIVKGLADNGGLYVPESFPTVTSEEMSAMAEMSYPERAAFVLGKYLAEELGADYLKEICEKAYYNFAIFMGVSSKDKTCYMNDPVRKAASMGRAIALGGRLSEFDPCNIGGELTGSARNAALPTGHGYIYKEGKLVRIVVPLAEEEDE